MTCCPTGRTAPGLNSNGIGSAPGSCPVAFRKYRESAPHLADVRPHRLSGRTRIRFPAKIAKDYWARSLFLRNGVILQTSTANKSDRAAQQRLAEYFSWRPRSGRALPATFAGHVLCRPKSGRLAGSASGIALSHRVKPGALPERLKSHPFSERPTISSTASFPHSMR